MLFRVFGRRVSRLLEGRWILGRVGRSLGLLRGRGRNNFRCNYYFDLLDDYFYQIFGLQSELFPPNNPSAYLTFQMIAGFQPNILGRPFLGSSFTIATKGSGLDLRPTRPSTYIHAEIISTHGFHLMKSSFNNNFIAYSSI
jgi:hypothetical protein